MQMLKGASSQCEAENDSFDINNGDHNIHLVWSSSAALGTIDQVDHTWSCTACSAKVLTQAKYDEHFVPRVQKKTMEPSNMYVINDV